MKYETRRLRTVGRRWVLAGALAGVGAATWGGVLRGADVVSTWVGGDGDWSVAGNWSNVPGVAQFPNNGNGGLTYDAIATTGTLTLGGDATIQKFTLSGGTLTGGSNLTANELLTWSGGTFAGSGTTSAAGGLSINLGSGGAVLSQRTLSVASGQSGSWTGIGDLTMKSGATIANAGTFSIQNDQSIFKGSGAAPVFRNTGTLTKSGGTGTTHVNVSLENTGSIVAQSGTLNFNGGGSTSGSVTGAGNIGFDAGTMNISGTYALTGRTEINGATVNFGVASSIGALTVTGGALGGGGTVDVDGLFTWSGGSIWDAGTTNANGGMLIDPAVSASLSQRVLHLAAGQTTTWSGAGALYFSSGAVLNNAGAFDIQNDQTIYNNGGAKPRFVNSGTLTKSAGTGISQINVELDNTGGIVGSSGTLRFNGGGSSTGSISGSATVGFGAGTMEIGGTYSVAGSTLINGGTVNFNTAAPATTGSLTLSAGTLGGAGVFTVNGTFEWDGGGMLDTGTTNANGGMRIAFTGAGGTLSQRTLNLAAGKTATWVGTGDLFVNSGAILNNAGTFNILNDQTVFHSGGAQPLFNNTGTLKKSGGGGVSQINIRLDNSGSIVADSGTLRFDGGGTSSGSISGAGAIAFGASTTDIDGSYAVTGETIINGGTVNFNAPTATSGAATLSAGELAGAATFTASGLFTWTGGSMLDAGTTNANGGMLISAGVNGAALSERTLNLAVGKTAAWTGTGNLFLDSGAVINNGGQFDIQNNQTIFNGGGSQSVINNTGSLSKSSGTGTSEIQVRFNNSGSVRVDSGVLKFTGSVAQASGATLTGGTWSVGAGAQLTLANTGSFTTNQGTVYLDGAGSTFAHIDALATNAGSFRLSGGRVFNTAGALANSGTIGVSGAGTTLTVNGAYTQSAGITDLGAGGTAINAAAVAINAGSLIGSGTIAAPLTIAGIVAPGQSAGAIDVAGNITLTSTAQAFFQIGGTAPGTEFDLLAQTSGTALSLDGTLTLSLINGAQNLITPSDTFEIIVAGGAGLTGTFANAPNGTRLTTSDGLGSFMVNYSAAGVTLTDFESIPEPSAALLVLLGSAALIARRRRNRSRRPQAAM